MNKNKRIAESWERDSVNAWGYSRSSQYESWEVVVHKMGTAGNMDTYSLGREYHNMDSDNWEVVVNPNYLITGINAREQIYESIGL